MKTGRALGVAEMKGLLSYFQISEALNRTWHLHHLKCILNVTLADIRCSALWYLNNWGFEASKCCHLQTLKQRYLNDSSHKSGLTLPFEINAFSGTQFHTLYWNKLVYHILTSCVLCTEGIWLNAFLCDNIMVWEAWRWEGMKTTPLVS